MSDKEITPIQQDTQRGLSQDALEDLRSEFTSIGGIVSRLPDIKSVRDQTMVVAKNGDYKFLFMVVEGEWKLVKSLQPTWDDLKFPASSGKLPASSTPTWVTWNTDFQLLSFDYGDKIYFYVQLPHVWEAGTEIAPHLHLTLSNNAVSGDLIKWNLTYTWANINGIFPASTTITGGEQQIADATLVKKANEHFIYGFPKINGKGKKLSSMMVFELERISTSNNYADDLFLLEFDIHILKTEDGSEEEYKQIIIEQEK